MRENRDFSPFEASQEAQLWPAVSFVFALSSNRQSRHFHVDIESRPVHLLSFRRRKESVEKTKERASPWKLGGLTMVQLAKRVWREIQHDEVFTRSAALSYYFFSALIPMVFFLMAVLGMFASQSEQLRNSLLNYAGRVMPPEAFTLVEKTLREISNNSTGLKLAFGLALSLWAGAGGMSSIVDALHHCYNIE